MAYRREILTLRKPDGSSCGAAIWQERNGQVEIDVKCTQGMGIQALEVVLVEKGGVQRAGTYNRTKGTGGFTVRTEQGQGVALCTDGGYIAAAGFLQGCTQNLILLQARLHAAWRSPDEETKKPDRRGHETAQLSLEEKAQKSEEEPARQGPRELDGSMSFAGRRTLIWRGSACIGQLWQANAWPPVPLAPGAAHKDGVFCLSQEPLQDFVTGMNTV